MSRVPASLTQIYFLTSEKPEQVCNRQWRYQGGLKSR